MLKRGAPTLGTTILGTDTLGAVLRHVENVVMAVSILVALVLAAAQVVLRYGFNTGAIWIEPTVVDLTVLGAMMGGSRAVATNAHVRVGILVDWLPHRVRRWVNLLAAFVSVAYCLFVFWAGTQFVQFLQMTGQVSVETGLPTWVEFLVTPVAMAFFVARYLLLLPRIWRGEVLQHEAALVD